MPRLILCPMPQPTKGVCIGTYEGQPLVVLGKHYVAGDRTLTQAEIGEELVEAVDDAASRVLGHEWVTSLARLTQLNRRTTSKDRIAKWGLPEYALKLLAEAAAHSHPRALGHALLAVVEIQDTCVTAETPTGHPAEVDVTERNMVAAKTLRKALVMLDDVLDERFLFQRRKESQEAQWPYRDEWRAPLTDK